MFLDSSSQTSLNQARLTSAPKEHHWIQPPISELTFFPTRFKVLDGMYAVPLRAEDVLVSHSSLALELSAWEAASDEALLNFEEQIRHEEG